MHKKEKKELSKDASSDVWSIGDIREYENNPLVYSDHQIEKIGESIKKYGFLTPLIITTDGELIAGHGRLAAAKSIGYQQVPVRIVDNLTEDEIREYRLLDNSLREILFFVVRKIHEK